ncbi:hypothetical protein CORC01_05983 [Colletotrichum orchidophilum]|uniref:Uncharacterized protein n=1 Tax=Colletotrichum orchidophilum TaxID=1209926 RepID=A0A1G4BBD4_9PEZI|nr:uncharacterized protein CORC01_05983 [Colletotrichum orchidophilum]OHE98717.1 hypothetical protein CORC01_05983 [Colletotrichum orchidophilum]
MANSLRPDEHHEASPADRGGTSPMARTISQNPGHAPRSSVIYITRDLPRAIRDARDEGM